MCASSVRHMHGQAGGITPVGAAHLGLSHSVVTMSGKAAPGGALSDEDAMTGLQWMRRWAP